MIGRVVYAAIVVGALAAAPASAGIAKASVTAVTWHRNGVLSWERIERRTLQAPVIHRWIPGMSEGRTKVIARGHSGVLEAVIGYSQRDGGPLHRQALATKILLKPSPRIIAEGIGNAPLAEFEARGLAKMAYVTRGAMLMLATAYTAECSGCGGMTAIGRRAGHGIVAVDPRVIPLGTRLFIPGYGLAVAGDTGGDIVGHRIDLGFDTWRDAMLFGRRAITVYPLK